MRPDRTPVQSFAPPATALDALYRALESSESEGQSLLRQLAEFQRRVEECREAISVNAAAHRSIGSACQTLEALAEQANS